jgi:hypothetical protein
VSLRKDQTVGSCNTVLALFSGLEHMGEQMPHHQAVMSYSTFPGLVVPVAEADESDALGHSEPVEGPGKYAAQVGQH